MRGGRNNYAFIDEQNLYLGLKSLGWDMDYSRFRVHLAETYGVSRAFVFFGYVATNEGMYKRLRTCGYELIFKEVSRDHTGTVKGNVDVLLTLHALLRFREYEKAVLISSDGDFAPLVQYWVVQKKLRAVIAVQRRRCSYLLRKAAGGYLDYLESLDDEGLLEKTKRRP